MAIALPPWLMTTEPWAIHLTNMRNRPQQKAICHAVYGTGIEQQQSLHVTR